MIWAGPRRVPNNALLADFFRKAVTGNQLAPLMRAV
jgi:hypothetical protein